MYMHKGAYFTTPWPTQGLSNFILDGLIEYYCSFNLHVSYAWSVEYLYISVSYFKNCDHMFCPFVWGGENRNSVLTSFISWEHSCLKLEESLQGFQRINKIILLHFFFTLPSSAPLMCVILWNLQTFMFSSKFSL